MALGFKEKRELQRIVSTKQTELGAGGMPFKAKREAQKAMADALTRLNAAIKNKPDLADENQKLADLIAGKFNDVPPERFLAILKEIVKEIGDVDPVKEPTIRYIEANAEKSAA